MYGHFYKLGVLFVGGLTVRALLLGRVYIGAADSSTLPFKPIIVWVLAHQIMV